MENTQHSVVDKEVDRSKEKLKTFIQARITDLFGGILDFTEVAVGEKERYKALRSKVLKLSNDTIRLIGGELDKSYSVTYIPQSVDVIIVNNKVSKQ